jgi:hypothetical protein
MNSSWLDPKLSQEIEQAIDRGLSFLRQHQLPSGEFRSYRANDAAMEQSLLQESCVFPTALITNSLLFLAKSSGVEEMLMRATDFLLGQTIKGGVWSHFAVGNPLRRLVGPDVDDTACVSSVLEARGITQPLANNRRLLLANRNSKGLFYTWFVTRPCWSFNPTYWRIVLSEWKRPKKTLRYWRKGETKRNAVDAVVNANVLYYLGSTPETQPVIDYLLRVIAAGDEARSDFWYHDLNVIYYFFSRNYWRGISSLEAARQPMIDRIRAQAQENGRLGGSTLETAMGVCALLNLGVQPLDLIPSIRFLLKAQSPVGDWRRSLLYFGGPSKSLGWGSEELTSAFCLEGLARFALSSDPSREMH